jgi:hypothetical protein
MPARQKSEFYECQHVRPSGKKYAAIAIRGHRFCYFHLQSPRSRPDFTSRYKAIMARSNTPS